MFILSKLLSMPWGDLDTAIGWWVIKGLGCSMTGCFGTFVAGLGTTMSGGLGFGVAGGANVKMAHTAF